MIQPQRTGGITYATVCSGIECMSVACRGLPMRPVFFSEIEPFPCAVLKAHYPDVPNLGDMSKIEVHPIFAEPVEGSGQSHAQWEITNGTTRIRLSRQLDILAGGTPCQDVSVAGKRAGMQEGSGTRSSLAFDFVRLARELSPRYVVWENVSGCIDSKNAPDFLAFLRALGDCGYSLAWRVLDAQYVRVDGMERAVPQRRRRVWVVGCLGADESRAAEILLEPDCVAGDSAPRRRAGQGFAYSLARRDNIHAGVVGDAPGTRSGGLQSATGGGCLNPLDPQMKRIFTPDGVFHTLAANNGAGQATDGVCIALDDGDKLKPRADQRKGGNGFGVNCDGAGYTLTGVDRHGVAYKAVGGNGKEDVSEVITARSFKGIGARNGEISGAFAAVECYENHATDSRVVPTDSAPVMGATRNGNASNNNPLVVHAVAIDQQGGKGAASTAKDISPSILSDSHGTPHAIAHAVAQNSRDEVRSVGVDGQIAGALAAEPGMKQQAYVVESQGLDVFNQTLAGDVSQTCRALPPNIDHLPCVVSTNSNGEAVMPCLTARDLVARETGEADKAVCHVVSRAVAHGINPVASGMMLNTPPHEEQAETLRKSPNGENGVIIENFLAAMRHIVRRLTPTECERLMGLPDGYTIPVGLAITDALVVEFRRIHDAFGAIMSAYANKPAPKPKTANQVRKWLEKITNPATCPDSPRYKACGNGWATNQPRWILCRLLAADGIDPFDPATNKKH